jgi:hypothetical protein
MLIVGRRDFDTGLIDASTRYRGGVESAKHLEGTATALSGSCGTGTGGNAVSMA